MNSKSTRRNKLNKKVYENRKKIKVVKSKQTHKFSHCGRESDIHMEVVALMEVENIANFLCQKIQVKMFI